MQSRKATLCCGAVLRVPPGCLLPSTSVRFPRRGCGSGCSQTSINHLLAGKKNDTSITTLPFSKKTLPIYLFFINTNKFAFKWKCRAQARNAAATPRHVCKVLAGVWPCAWFCGAGHKRHRSELKCREAAALLGLATQVRATPARSALSKARLMSLLAHISPHKVPLWPQSSHLPKMLYPIRKIFFFCAVQEGSFPIHKKKGCCGLLGMVVPGR